METHVRLAGKLLFWSVIAMAVVAIVVLIGAGGYSGLYMTDNPFYKRKDLASIPLDRVLASIYITYCIVMAAPLAIAGRGIELRRPWARTYSLLAAAVNMLNFPIGTAVGAYTVWVLQDEATEFLFDDRGPGR
ncbi:MAG: hypothetical protein FJW30_25685 [Acidobacteria bacterium]|nr:hypothetical protein [Acidobacteriota bacterium]